MAVAVKICGITRVEDGLAAAQAGAHAIGLVFHRASPRCIAPDAAAAIVARLPPFVTAVGLFVDAEPAQVRAVLDAVPLQLLQFHGDEPPDYCLQFKVRTMKAFRIRDAESLRELPQYKTNFWLLDAYTPDKPGGTGEKFNWDLAVEAQKLGRPIFLAGGLTPENVAEAVQRVRPYGVDVSSGVESAPGRKDHAKVRAFIRAARAA